MIEYNRERQMQENSWNVHDYSIQHTIDNNQIKYFTSIFINNNNLDLHPLTVFNHGQWWSIFITHRWHFRQWWDLGALYPSHILQYCSIFLARLSYLYWIESKIVLVDEWWWKQGLTITFGSHFKGKNPGPVVVAIT